MMFFIYPFSSECMDFSSNCVISHPNLTIISRAWETLLVIVFWKFGNIVLDSCFWKICVGTLVTNLQKKKKGGSKHHAWPSARFSTCSTFTAWSANDKSSLPLLTCPLILSVTTTLVCYDHFGTFQQSGVYSRWGQPHIDIVIHWGGLCTWGLSPLGVPIWEHLGLEVSLRFCKIGQWVSKFGVFECGDEWYRWSWFDGGALVEVRLRHLDPRFGVGFT
jgi:hypothetical protein